MIYNDFQQDFLTIIYYYYNLKNNKVDIDIENIIIEYNFEQIDETKINYIEKLAKLVYSKLEYNNIIYDENFTNDKLLINYYNNIIRKNKLKKIIDY